MPGTPPVGRSLLGAPARYPTGLEELGGGLWAWLQPNGGLGESNAGLVVGAGESLLIDTLWDLRLTETMLAAMAPLTGSAPIRLLVNTHADGDHCWGNQLLHGVPIIATEAAAQDMMREDPQRLRFLSRAGARLNALGRACGPAGVSLPGARQLVGISAFPRMLAAYDFDRIALTPPTNTFTGRRELTVGGRRVELFEVGPAHTPGDLILHVPDERVVFAGDLVFAGLTPIMWVGPVENWIAGLDRILALEPRLVLGGHGPTTGASGVVAVRSYWEFVAGAVRQRLDRGFDAYSAARDVLHSPEFAERPFAGWDAAERLVINAAIIARNDAGQRGRVSEQVRVRLLARMGLLGAELSAKRSRPAPRPRARRRGHRQARARQHRPPL